MDFLKQLIFNRFRTFALLTMCMVISIILLMVRIKLTHSFFYLFLVWNLFLAIIPFAITIYLLSLAKLSRMGILIAFGIWLLFLPNAAYIVTDLIHLRLSDNNILWLDFILVSSFAITGLMFFYYSIAYMKNILETYLNKKTITYVVNFTLFVSAFGIFLGRFLRYNSWEILSNPKYLIVDILNIVFNPITYKGAWLFTLMFGMFLWQGHWVFKKFYSTPSK